MFNLLIIVVGGGIGAGIRHLANLGALRLVGPNFPWGTMAINVVGSFVMGLFIAMLVRRGGSAELRLFVATGILGGFTTFSAFSLDSRCYGSVARHCRRSDTRLPASWRDPRPVSRSLARKKPALSAPRRASSLLFHACRYPKTATHFWATRINAIAPFRNG